MSVQNVEALLAAPRVNGGTYFALASSVVTSLGSGASPQDQNNLEDAVIPGALRADLVEGKDFVWAPEEAIRIVEDAFGVRGKRFPRLAYAEDAIDGADGVVKVEGWPQPVTVRSSTPTDPATTVTLLLPRRAVACEVLNAVLSDAAAPSLGLPAGVDRSSLRVLISPDRVASPWRLLANDIPLEHVCPLDPGTGKPVVVHIQIEVRRDDGRWPLGVCYAPGYEPMAAGVTTLAWRSSLSKGSYVDAQDSTGKWYNARIVDVVPATATGATTLSGASLTSPVIAVVHFRGWSARFDERIELPGSWHRILPLYERVAPWRQGLRPGDSVEVKDESHWFGGVVESLDFTRLPARACVVYHTCKAGQPLTDAKRTSFALEEDEVLDFFGAHLKQADRTTTIRPAAAPPAPAVPSWIVSAPTAPIPPLARATLAWAQTFPAPAAAAAAAAGGSGAPAAAPPRISSPAAATGGSGAPTGVASPSAAGSTAVTRYAYRGSLPTPRSGARIVPGVSGFRNLRNTCYMNSVLQCLTACSPLTAYFLDDARGWGKDLNKDNFMGTGGAVASTFARWTQLVWGGTHEIYIPQELRRVIAAKAEQFAGDQQHDSQELLCFLLDALMEDTCRIRGRKPYCPDVECDGSDITAKGDLAWANHLSRSDGHVTDLFTGQYISDRTCLGCNTRSVKFETFNNWQLPLPPEYFRSVDIYYFGLFNSRPAKYKFWYRMDNAANQTGRHVCDWISKTIAEDWRLFDEYSKAVEAGDEKAAAELSDKAAGVDEEGDHANGGSGTGSRTPSPAAGAAKPLKPVARPLFPVPKPNELLLTYTTASPCIVKQVVPHWAHLSVALAQAKQKYGDAAALSLMVWHVPNAPEYTEPDAPHTPVAASAAATTPTAAAGTAAAAATMPSVGPSSVVRSITSVVRSALGGTPRARGTSPAASAGLGGGADGAGGDGTAGAWPIDYDEPDPEDRARLLAEQKEKDDLKAALGGFYEEMDGGVSIARAPRECKLLPRPTHTIGPRMEDWVQVWQRAPEAPTSNGWGYVTRPAHAWRTIADPLAIPTKWVPAEAPAAAAAAPAAATAGAAVAGGAATAAADDSVAANDSSSGRAVPFITNNQLWAGVWQRMKRLLNAGTCSEAEPPYRLRYFVFDYETERLKLDAKFYDVTNPHLVDIPRDDEPWVPRRDVQVVMDFLSPELYQRAFDFKEGQSSVHHRSVKSDAKGSVVPLKTCIDMFEAEEVMDGDNAVNCSKCGDKKPSRKKMRLWRLPPFLTVHFKRFQHDNNAGELGLTLRGKIHSLVNFPTKGLDLSEHVARGSVEAGGAMYDLFAVSNHHGMLGYGHYTAHTYHEPTGRWYRYDDERYSLVKEEDVVTPSAYVVFYKRRDVSPEEAIAAYAAATAAAGGAAAAAAAAGAAAMPATAASASASTSSTSPAAGSHPVR